MTSNNLFAFVIFKKLPFAVQIGKTFFEDCDCPDNRQANRFAFRFIADFYADEFELLR